MHKKEIFYVGLMLIGSLITFFVTKSDDKSVDKLTPYELLEITAAQNKYVSTDELARKIMSDDQTIRLIDLRSKAEFEKFSLRGAINIPLESVLNEEYEDVLNQEIYTNIFYSNSSDMAAKVWFVSKRLGYDNNYILRGGLNRWVETILKPKQPLEIASRAEFDLYNFRKAASSYFGGGGVVKTSNALSDKASTSVPIKRKKKEAAGGGCD